MLSLSSEDLKDIVKGLLFIVIPLAVVSLLIYFNMRNEKRLSNSRKQPIIGMARPTPKDDEFRNKNSEPLRPTHQSIGTVQSLRKTIGTKQPIRIITVAGDF